MKHIIVYHSNCMDGLGSAFIANKAIENLKEPDEPIILLPLYYQSEYKLFKILDYIEEPVIVTMVDFSFKRPEMLKLINHPKVSMIKVLDHHETAHKELHNIKNSKFEFIYDNDKSGAIITYEYFLDHHDLQPDIFAYIQDRDLWKWELINSKEISACLNWEIIPNDVKSFESWYNYYNEAQPHELDEMLIRGKSYLNLINESVKRKLKNARRIKLNDKEIMIINASDNISELGHAICKEYQLPSCMFFITTEFKVVLSFRSEDHLDSAQEFALSFPGGGGHRNASGATISLDELNKILKG